MIWILDHLAQAIDEYESITANRLVAQKGEWDWQRRKYICKQHIKCSFYASFGRRYKSNKVVLKRCNLDHCGILSTGLAKDGRVDKTRRKGKLNQTISTVLKVKAGNPVPSDVVKTSQAIHGQRSSYDQAWRSLNTENKIQQMKNEESFQLIGPYLRKFHEKNPQSGVAYDVDEDGRTIRLFLIPGVMFRKLRYVRPVISMDTCHLRSKFKGTLYTATVLSAANEIYPFAFAITRDNENTEGWTYFCENLKLNLQVMESPNRIPRCSTYGYFLVHLG